MSAIWEMRNDLKYIRKNMTDVKLIDHFTFITEQWKYRVTVGDKRYIIMVGDYWSRYLADVWDIDQNPLIEWSTSILLRHQSDKLAMACLRWTERKSYTKIRP